MGFRPSLVGNDIWMRFKGDHYEYITTITDDLLIFGRNPEKILQELKDTKNYEFKDVGEPEYYNGADIIYNNKLDTREFPQRNTSRMLLTKSKTLWVLNSGIMDPQWKLETILKLMKQISLTLK